MADQQELIETPETPEIIAPGYTFGTVTDQISTVVLTKKTPVFWTACFGVGFSLLLVFLYAVAVLFVRYSSEKSESRPKLGVAWLSNRRSQRIWSEAADCFRLSSVDIEHGQEPRELKHVVELVAQIRQMQRCPLFLSADVRGDQYAQTRAVDVGHVRHV